MYATEDRGTHLAIALFENGNKHEILIDYTTYERMLSENVKLSLHQDNRSDSFFVKIYSINKIRVSRSFSKWIIGATENEFVAFKNSNTKNFLEDNLSLTDRTGIGQNRVGAQKNSKSNIRGVSYCKKRKNWSAAVYFKRKRVFFKRYDDVELAEENVIRVRQELMSHSFSDKEK